VRGIQVEWQELPKGSRAQVRFLKGLDRFDAVWWHRHLLVPWTTPTLRHAARRLVFDYDDPLTRSVDHGGRYSVTRRIRFARLVSRCDAVAAASQTLAGMALPYTEHVVIVPTVVALPDEPALRAREGPVRLVWLDPSGDKPFLELVRPVLEKLGTSRRDVCLRVVGHHQLSFGDLPVEFRPWSPREEQESLAQSDLGLCPMPDNPWTGAKCPVDVLHFMAHGLPFVASAVGELVEVARNGHEPFGACCPLSPDAWFEALADLLDDADCRRRMGAAGRQFAASHNAVPAVVDRLQAALTGAAAPSAAPPAS
jgi:glycosyltransferase involved in cell wall biosynthesis